MINRIKNTEPPVRLPIEWTEEVLELLNSVYSTQINALKKEFEVFSLSYKEELFLAVSFLEKNTVSSVPVTYLASVDLKAEDSDKLKKLLNTMVDSVGVFFDRYFSEEDWNEYSNRWEETTFKGVNIFYLITRENIGLMLQADELLKNSLN